MAARFNLRTNVGFIGSLLAIQVGGRFLTRQESAPYYYFIFESGSNPLVTFQTTWYMLLHNIWAYFLI